MAKSINERAYDYAIEEAQVEGFDFGSVKDGYIQGATEMLEKAVKWLNDNKVRTDIVGYFLDTQREEMREEFIEEFKKAMEE